MPPSFPARSAIGLLLLAACATAGCDRQTPAREQANAAAATPDEVTADEVAPGNGTPAPQAGAIDRSHRGEAAPTLAFKDPDGKPVTLAAFRGKPLLLNLWATWCAPCIKEMPSLDTAAAGLAGKTNVLAVSQDIDAAKAAPFFVDRKLTTLKPYTDPDMGLSMHYKVNLPTTILYDAKGHEMWRVSGAMDWAGPEAKAALAEG